ncbi:MAG: fimbria/pilus outer membrane usher protein [Bacteriovoracaceae bacterium]|nr:fimbria/pilus outer membrane usher protein [Bacteriovoracaceae bacterium]
MTKIFLLFILCSINAFAQEALKPIVFAQQEYEAPLPLIVNGNNVSEVKVKIKNEEISAFEKISLVEALKNSVSQAIWSKIEKLPGDWIEKRSLPLEINYNPQEANLILTVSQSNTATTQLEATEDPKNIYASQALMPAPFGGAINYRVEKSWGSNQLGGETFSTYFDSFINMKGVVLENQSYYFDNQGQVGWFRGDTRLVKDFQEKRVRLQAGDVYPQGFGFMTARPVGGIHVARNFSLDPYRIAFPQGQGQFTLQTRSRVKTYVNGVQIKDEFLPAGNYDLKDIPLINGLNTVIVETTDELGTKKMYEFKLPTSVGLLKAKEWNFSLSHGRPFSDSTFKRNYIQSDLTSAFVQYGLNQSVSLGGYGQKQNNFSLSGLESGLATNAGNFFLGAAASRDETHAAGAGSATWQLQSLGSQLFNAYTITLRHERYGDGFQNQMNGVTSILRSQWQGNITIPIRGLLTASFGSTYGDVRNPALADRKSWDATFNIRAWTNLNISMFMSRTRDENKNWNDVAYAFFTWTFDNASHFVSGFHDVENKINRLTAVRDNRNRLYSPRLTAVAEEGPSKDLAEVDGYVPTPMADIGGRITGAQFDNAGKTQSRGVARLASAFVFGYQNDQWGAGFSRPVPNSFVLFKPSQNLKKQTVALRSTSPYTEGQSGPLGEITFTNLLPYQYREIQLDPTGLDEGTSLIQERFVVYPTYRSAHVINIQDKGSVVLTGLLVDTKGVPLALKVGNVSGKPFFTSREGRFFIEGLEPGVHQLTIEGLESIDLEVDKTARGIKDLGRLEMDPEEE